MRAVQTLRWISIVEGLSYLALLMVAMPLKYIWDQPIYVRMVGSAHGLLFVLFAAALVWAAVERKWHVTEPVLLFVASLIPFGFLFIEFRLRADLEPEAESRAFEER